MCVNQSETHGENYISLPVLLKATDSLLFSLRDPSVYPTRIEQFKMSNILAIISYDLSIVKYDICENKMSR